MKSIYTYSSARDFLKDRFHLEKSQARGITLAKFGAQFGMSGSMLKMILEGSRKLSIEKSHFIAKALHLSFEEQEYFEALLLAESASPHHYPYYKKRLKKLKSDERMRKVPTTVSSILSQWYLPALLIHLVDSEIIQNEGFTQENFLKIEKKLGLRRPQVEQLLVLFQQEGFLKIKTGDKPHIVFNKLTSKVPQKKYLKDVLSESVARLDREFENPNAAYLAHSFSIPEDCIEDLVSDFKNLLEHYMSLYDTQKKPSVVIQTGFQLFPVI